MMDKRPALALLQPPTLNCDFDLAAASATGHHSFEDAEIVKYELDVPDSLVGVILGHGGRGIVDLQHATQTTIQISRKGTYVPGTNDRIVTITGARVS